MSRFKTSLLSLSTPLYILMASISYNSVAWAYSTSTNNRKPALASQRKNKHSCNENEMFSKARRAFLSSVLPVTVSTISISSAAGIDAITSTSGAATITQKIKVTPVAHTFVTSSNPSGDVKVKPLRENDATRFLTNARIVFFFYSGTEDKASKLASEVVDLTVKRKAGEGAGVTPGQVHLADISGSDSVATKVLNYASQNGISILKSSSSDIESTLSNIVKELESESGDVILVPPRPSHGTFQNAMVVQDTAKKCGLRVGGARGGGVISILLNGSRDPDLLVVSEQGQEASTILWYDI